MKKTFISIFSLLAILSLIPLQWLWLSYSYRVWENSVYQSMENSFNAAYETELINRVNSIKPPEGTKVSIPDLKSDDAISMYEYIGFNDFANKFHHPRNYKRLRVLIDKELANRAICGLNYRILNLRTDTSHYKEASDFFNDTTFKNISFNIIRTHIIPIRYDLTEGIQLIAINPYKVILSKMHLILVVSFLIISLVLISLIYLYGLLKRLRAIARLRQDYTYDIIHNMGTPLSTAKSINESLLAHYEDNNQNISKKNSLNQLGKTIERIDTMCNQVLTVAKLEQGRISLEKQDINFNSFLGSLINSRKVKQSRNKLITYLYNNVNGTIFTDPLFLEQIINNLLDNSVKYSGESVTIMFSLCTKGKYRELTVSDNGFGISESERKNVINLYSRGSNTGNIQGHGIGLHFIELVMKAQKGYIKINSEVNKGTIVILGFPLK